MLFNKKLLGLRDKKKGLVEDLNRDIDRLEQIQVILVQSNGKPISRPAMRPEEVPEKKYEYTKERLLEFKKELESKSASSNKTEEDGGGLGGFGSGGNKPGSAKRAEPTQAEIAAKTAHLESLQPLWQNREAMSPSLQKINQAKEIRLLSLVQLFCSILKLFIFKIGV